MWIEIPDAIEDFLKQINNAMDKASFAINALFESMIKGQHIVFASRKVLKILENWKYINPSNKNFISWIREKYVFLYACEDSIKYKIVVTVTSNTISVNDNIYEVPLEYFFDFKESKLLTENESDGAFFINIYHYIRKQRKADAMFTIKLENDSCHGANVVSKLKQSAKDNRIAICILDSDKETYTSARGSTYKGANDIFKKIRNNHIILLVPLGVREKENLIPPQLYMACCDEKSDFLSVLNKFIEQENIIKYFNIKDGIKFKKISECKKEYEKVFLEYEKVGILRKPDNEEDADFLCVEGVGEKACDKVGKLLLENDESFEKEIERMPEEKRKKILLFRKELNIYIPKYLYAEWEEIYDFLFSWGCCISEKSLPFYEL